MSEKPRCLVLGATGFIGRNFINYLVRNELASAVRAVDKAPPAMANLSAEHRSAFESDTVEFKQANLTNAASTAKAFAPAEGEAPFELVFNCAAETKFGQDDAVYKHGVVGLSEKCAAEAARCGCSRFVELSTAQVYEPKKGRSGEDASVKPWTALAAAKFEAEGIVTGTAGLRSVVLRPATVYGTGDFVNLFPRVICGAVYKHLKEKYKLLWSGDLCINTVHVRDVNAAMWHVAAVADPPSGAVFNVSDSAGTTQSSFNAILEEVFGIKTGFLGTVMSNLAKVKMNDVVEGANDKHMEPWADMCKTAGIVTPLTAFIDKELLYNNHLSVSGDALSATGFSYEVAGPTAANVREIIDEYVEQGIFPKEAV